MSRYRTEEGAFHYVTEDGNTFALAEDAEAAQKIADALNQFEERQRDPATHRCKVCGALWRFYPRSGVSDVSAWSLRSPGCGQCCDNAPMADQIEPLPKPRPRKGRR